MTNNRGRISYAHPPWLSGQYVTYFLERQDGSWIALQMTIMGQDEDGSWAIFVDAKQPDADIQIGIRFDPTSGDPGDPMRFQSMGWRVTRGAPNDGESARGLEMTVLSQNLLNVADFSDVTAALRGAPTRVSLPCGIASTHAFDDQHPLLPHTTRHELNTRVPITGVARSTIIGSSTALTVCSFGCNNPQINTGNFDDFVDFSHATTTEHEGFALTYPATWFLRPKHTEDRRVYFGQCGGNANALSCAVSVRSGSPAEIDQLEKEEIASLSVPQPGGAAVYVPKTKYKIGIHGAIGFELGYEHPHIDGLVSGAIYKSRDRARLAVVRVLCCISKRNPRRDEVLRTCPPILHDVVESFEFR